MITHAARSECVMPTVGLAIQSADEHSAANGAPPLTLLRSRRDTVKRVSERLRPDYSHLRRRSVVSDGIARPDPGGMPQWNGDEQCGHARLAPAGSG